MEYDLRDGGGVAFDLFADYFQMYVEDETADRPELLWEGPGDVEAKLASYSGGIALGTFRNMTVPLKIEVSGVAPELSSEDWPHVVTGSVEFPSGRVVVMGCTDFVPDADRLLVVPGSYRFRYRATGQDTLSADGLDGADRYELILWPGVSQSRAVTSSVPA